MMWQKVGEIMEQKEPISDILADLFQVPEDNVVCNASSNNMEFGLLVRLDRELSRVTIDSLAMEFVATWPKGGASFFLAVDDPTGRVYALYRNYNGEIKKDITFKEVTYAGDYDSKSR